jgi:fatty acid desaturase
VVVAAIISGSLHSWFIYSVGIYSLHEGAAHKLIFPSKGRLSQAAQFLAANLCRLSATDPDYYAACHMAHHAKFGTEQDSEFLNFVRPRRFWLTLLPLASFVNYSDFVAHRPLHYTRGRVISALIGVLYNGIYAYLIFRRFGGLFALIVLALTPHLGFYMDRMRQFTEHNLMPLENKSGTRSFGAGFFALLIGGGPWGQPCHMAHHLVASIPWYQQIALHRFIVNLLTEKQKQQFLLPPGLGFPRLLWRVVREANAFSRTAGKAT